MKKNYIAPLMEVVEDETEILAASGEEGLSLHNEKASGTALAKQFRGGFSEEFSLNNKDE